MARFGVHPSDTDSGSDSTIHYGVTAILQPSTIIIIIIIIILLLLIIIIKKNWRAAGLELTTIAPSRTIVTDGNC